MTQAALGIDVGTGSVRAGLFDLKGRRLGVGVEEIQIWRPREDFVEQSSDDIWRAAGRAVRTALAEAGIEAKDVVGIGFDATCSLVLLDAEDRPVSVSPSGKAEQNVIVKMFATTLPIVSTMAASSRPASRAAARSASATRPRAFTIATASFRIAFSRGSAEAPWRRAVISA